MQDSFMTSKHIKLIRTYLFSSFFLLGGCVFGIIYTTEAQNEKILADVKVKLDKIVTAKQFIVPNRTRTVGASSMISFRKTDSGRTCRQACSDYLQNTCLSGLKRGRAYMTVAGARRPEESFYLGVSCDKTGSEFESDVTVTELEVYCNCVKYDTQPMSSFSRHITVDGTLMAKDFVVKSPSGGQNILATLTLRNSEKRESCDQLCSYYNRKCTRAIRVGTAAEDACYRAVGGDGNELYCFCGGTSSY